jgi:N-acyl-phosphatidylethanolamine-hydrolysing phospholipase D
MRTLWDRDETLWCGYLIYIGPYTIYFAGDTGFGPFFPWIKDQAGKIDLALLPIGAYRPRWFMRPVHLDPEEAVQVHLLLKPSLSIGMHWGAFRQAEEPLGEPPLYLSYALKKLGVSEEEFRVLDLGETVVIGGRSY